MVKSALMFRISAVIFCQLLLCGSAGLMPVQAMPATAEAMLAAEPPSTVTPSDVTPSDVTPSEVTPSDVTPSAAAPGKAKVLPSLSPQLGLPFQASWQAAATSSFMAWQQQGKQLFDRSLLLAPRAAVVQITGEQQSGAIHYQHLLLQHYQPIPAWLLTPRVSRAQGINAILLLHDHGAEFRIGKDKWLPAALSLQPELSQHWQHKYFDGVALAHTLAEAGFSVLVADAPGFGERGPLQYEQQQQLAANLLAQGSSLAGLMAREDQALAQFLARQPGVRGVAAVGFSMGAMRALQLAAASDDIQAAVAVGWFDQLATLRQHDNNFSRGQSSFYLLHPGLYQQLDIPELVALAAPKPLLLLMGTADKLMPAASVTQAFQRLQQLYRACGSDAAKLKWQQGQGHRFGRKAQQQALDFLQQAGNQPADCAPEGGTSN